MELGSYLQLLKRWFWLIILAAGIAGTVSFFTTRSQPAIYQATATMQVGVFQDVPNPDSRMTDSAQKLVESYFVLTKTYPFLVSAVQKLTFTITPDDLASSFEIKSITDTPFFTVTATFNNAERAALIANTIAQDLAARTASTVEQRKAQIATLQGQIDGLITQLEKDRQELAVIDRYLEKPDSNADPILIQRQSELIARINQQRATLAQFQNNLIALQNQTTTNVLTIIEPARIPTASRGSSAVKDALLAAGIGMALAIGLIALLEQLDTTIKVSQEIQQLVKLPAIGTVPPYGRKATHKDKLIAWIKPYSSAAEAYRALRVNLMFLEGLSGPYRYIITGCRGAEGKSTTTANLAVAFANTGRQVIVIDADLRQPSQHLIFNLSNNAGLSDVLQSKYSDKNGQVIVVEGDPASDDVFYATYKNSKELTLFTVGQEATNLPFYSIPSDVPIQKTGIPRLHVITAGAIQSNPGDLLDSPKMRELIYYLVHEEGYEVILIDTPPILEVSDSSTLASTISVPVILTAKAHKTNRADLVGAVERFSILSIPVVGVVLNEVREFGSQSWENGQDKPDSADRTAQSSSLSQGQKPRQLVDVSRARSNGRRN